MKLKDNIVYRFESKILGGKTFIFDLYTGKILVSDKIAYEIMNMMNSGHSINEISKTLDRSSESIDAFISHLRNNEFLLEA